MRLVTTLAKVTSLLGAFLAVALLMGLIGAGLLLPVVGSAGTAAREGVGLFEELPGELEQRPLAQQSRIQTADGSLISTPSQENRIIVGLEDIAPTMQKAQIAIEDARFYDHGGLDPEALGRAVVTNATTDDTQGGSTLTQQYVKLSLLEEAKQTEDTEARIALNARSGTEGYVRKLRELKYAVTLEDRLTKDEILEGYLNLAFYGQGAYGVEAAARRYFGVSAAELRLEQSALLAGVVRSPSNTNPISDPEAAMGRRDVVLDNMYEQEMISEKAWRQAKATGLELTVRDSERSCLNSAHPYFCDYVTTWLLSNETLGETPEEREALLTTGGLTVTTTLDTELAETVRTTMRETTPRGNPYSLASAAAVVEPGTGHVLAIGQSSEYALEASEDGTSATSVNWSVDERFRGTGGFQIGSVAKAYSLVTALEQGIPVESTLSVRAPERIELEDGRRVPAGVFYRDDFDPECTIGEDEWTVRNANDENHDRTTTLREATASSVNTAFATLAAQIGTCEVRDTMARMGLNSGDGDAYGAGSNNTPSAYVLGADAATPLTVASSYATFGAGGLYCPPVPVTEIRDADGAEIPLQIPDCEQVVDPDVAAGVAELMQEVVNDSGSGFRAVLENDQPAGGKTGSSDGSKHTWFAGYTPQLSTAVWVGSPGEKFDGELRDFTIGERSVEGFLYGSKVAAPVWKVIMDEALAGADVEQFEQPSTTILQGKQQVVPVVAGLTLPEAQQRLGDAGLAGSAVRIASPQPEGQVLRTSPRAGSQTRAGTPLQIFVSGDDDAVDSDAVDSDAVDDEPSSAFFGPPEDDD